MQRRLQYEKPLLEQMVITVEGGYGYGMSNEGFGNGGTMDLSLDVGPRDYIFTEEDNY